MRLLVSAGNAPTRPLRWPAARTSSTRKIPSAGALGAVTIDVLREILSMVDGARPVSAALGDARDVTALERRVRARAVEGVAFVKIGFAGITDAARVTDLIASASVQQARTRARLSPSAMRTASASAASGATPSSMPRLVGEPSAC